MPDAMDPAGCLPPSQGGRWPFFPLAFLQDAARFLALADQRQLRLDGEGRLQIGSVRRLAAEAILRPKAADPRSEMQAPGLGLVAGLLGQAGYVAAVEDVLHLSALAHAWPGWPAPIELTRLRNTRWLAPTANTRWLPWDRRQRPLDSQWRALILEVCRWVAALPTGDRTPGAELYRQGAIAPPAAGYNLPRVRRAVRRQAQAQKVEIVYLNAAPFGTKGSFVAQALELPVLREAEGMFERADACFAKRNRPRPSFAARVWRVRWAR